jgi:hypothetical protein
LSYQSLSMSSRVEGLKAGLMRYGSECSWIGWTTM